MLPFVEVAHLPSASSFYAAVCQPLGLRFLSSAPSAPGPGVVFGSADPPQPAFELRAVAPTEQRPLRLSRLVLSAARPQAVNDFYLSALRASPQSPAVIIHCGSPTTVVPLTDGHGHPSSTRPSDTAAKTTDPDGNVMEVVYVPPTAYGSQQYGGSTVRRTQSTHAEVSRIMHWNYDVASAAPVSGSMARGQDPFTVARRPGHHDGMGEPGALVRRSTIMTTSAVHQPAPSPRENSRGISAAGIAGILGAAAVGAAAGAAISYGLTKHDRARAPIYEYTAPAPFQRRSTFPDPYPDHRNRFVEVERTVEKVRYPDDYPALPVRPSPPTHIARYSAARPLEADDGYVDTRSRSSSRYYPGGPRSRARSEAPSGGRPLLLTEGEHRSSVTSRHSAVPPPPPQSLRRSATYDVSEHDSYVSARSRRSSASTMRPPPAQAPVVLPAAPARSSSGGRVAVTGSRASASPSNRYPPRSRTGSYMTARNIALPPSGVGSSHADWDDDEDSVAPSDSISCVGSRRSGRSYH